MVKLKFIRPTLNLHEDVAIIGSSSKLKNKKFGQTIDTYHDVVRFNRAPTEGWEDYVGSKTTLRVANNHVFANVKHNVGGDENCLEWPSEGQPQNFIKELKNQRILLLNKDISGWSKRNEHVDESSKIFMADYSQIELLGLTQNPSVGYAFITLCVANGIKPTIFGFGLEEEDDKASHYWEDKDKISSSHGYKLERQNIKKWHKEGKIFLK